MEVKKQVFDYTCQAAVILLSFWVGRAWGDKSNMLAIFILILCIVLFSLGILGTGRLVVTNGKDQA